MATSSFHFAKSYCCKIYVIRNNMVGLLLTTCCVTKSSLKKGKTFFCRQEWDFEEMGETN